MPMYETMLITSATLDEEATTAVVGKFKSLIEANGTIDTVEEWGKRRLAYPINKEEDGVYTLIHFTSEADFPAELDRVYKITDGVLRTLIIVKDEVMEATRVAAAEKAVAAREAAAKAAADRAAAAEARAKEEVAKAAEAEAAKLAPPEAAAPEAAAEEAVAEEVVAEAAQPEAEA